MGLLSKTAEYKRKPRNMQDQHSIQEMSDEEIFLYSLSNPEAFSEIVDRYQPAFLRKAKDILKNEDDSYDATQEAFVRIYSAARKYRKQKGASFKSWAYKILMNQCFTAYQKNKKARARTADLDEEVILQFADEQQLEGFEQKISKDYLMSYFSKLPDNLFRTAEMFFIKGLPQQEIAEAQGVSHEVVRTRIYRAKKQLKDMGIGQY
jgi:RNA polymerase sigma-70 factor (ECF subfamily)